MRGYARVSLGVVIAGALLLSMASGASAAKAPVARAASCNWAAAYGPLFGGWSRSYRSDCWYTTTIVHYPKTYVSWEVVDGSDAQACVRAKGYRWRDGAAYWTSLGCGTSGGGYVHWGAYWHQVIDYHHVKVKSLMYPLGAPIYFK